MESAFLSVFTASAAGRAADPEEHFKSVLDQLAAVPTKNPVALLFDTK